MRLKSLEYVIIGDLIYELVCGQVLKYSICVGEDCVLRNCYRKGSITA